MTILPYERFTLISDLSAPELARALKPHFCAAKFYFLRGPVEPFRGSVDQDGFNIGWFPRFGQGVARIRGRFRPLGAGRTEIGVVQRPTTVFAVFAFVWLGFAVAFLVTVALPDPDLGRGAAAAFFAGLGALFFALGLFVFIRLFWDEARHTRHFLKLIFNADEK